MVVGEENDKIVGDFYFTKKVKKIIVNYQITYT